MQCGFHLEIVMQRDPTYWNIVMRDFNAKLDQKQEPNEVFIEGFGIDQRNEKGRYVTKISESM